MSVISLLLPVLHQPLASLPLAQKLEEIDFLGAFFLIPYPISSYSSDDRSIICLLIALQWGGTVYPWNDSKIIGLFVGFGLMIIIFAIIQFKKGDKGTIPISILKQRTVASAVIFSFFMAASFFTLIYYSTIRPHFKKLTSSTNLFPSHQRFKPIEIWNSITPPHALGRIIRLYRRSTRDALGVLYSFHYSWLRYIDSGMWAYGALYC
jgi:hypothetical protein